MEERKIKLLVVDDEKEICGFMESYFKRRGYLVFCAGSGEDALPIIKEQNPDIMLLDMNLPQMSGIDLLKLVREFNNTLKVIMVSGYDVDFKNAPEFKGLNILEFLRKPVFPEVLESTIKRAIA